MRRVRCPTTLRWPMNSLKVFGYRAICTSSHAGRGVCVGKVIGSPGEGSRLPLSLRTLTIRENLTGGIELLHSSPPLEAARRLQPMSRKIASTQEGAKRTGGETMRKQGL